MDILTLEPADLEAVTELDRLCFPPEVAFSPDMFRECLKSDLCRCFGIKENGALTAFAVLSYPAPEILNIVTIDVHPEKRRQGMGDALMREVTRIARQDKAARIALQVAVDNQAAIKLYEKHGFSVRGALEHYYGRGKHALLMDRDTP